MNLKVDFDKAPTLISLLLLTGWVFLFALILVALIYFVYWEMFPASYFRALWVNIFIVLVCDYFNKDKR